MANDFDRCHKCFFLKLRYMAYPNHCGVVCHIGIGADWQEGTPLRMTEGVFFHLIHRKRSPLSRCGSVTLAF